MTKNNINNIFNSLILCLLIFLAGTECCFADPVVAGANVVPFKVILFKFGLTMGAVILSLLIIWSALYYYKKLMQDGIKAYNQKALYGDNLKTPTTLDGAIISFINKNKL